MTWILVTKMPHRCRMPAVQPIHMEDFWVGSIWECGTCGKRYEITGWVTSGGWADSHPTWKDVTHRS